MPSCVAALGLPRAVAGEQVLAALAAVDLEAERVVGGEEEQGVVEVHPGFDFGDQLVEVDHVLEALARVVDSGRPTRPTSR